MECWLRASKHGSEQHLMQGEGERGPECPGKGGLRHWARYPAGTSPRVEEKMSTSRHGSMNPWCLSEKNLHVCVLISATGDGARKNLKKKHKSFGNKTFQTKIFEKILLKKKNIWKNKKHPKKRNTLKKSHQKKIKKKLLKKKNTLWL